MHDSSILTALLLGLIEGLTEFLPVSSTAHVLLAGQFLGFHSPGNSFAVLIQLGAILALVAVYGRKLFQLVLSVPERRESRHFVASVLIAFMPAALIGALAHGFIKSVLFETPVLICAMLIVGGIVLILVDRMVKRPRYDNAMAYPLSLSLNIGFIQCLAMIPGTSRSGATIVGAMLMGADKRSAAEFSFFLALPTMMGAFALDLYKNSGVIRSEDMMLIAIGFVAAFLSALVVVRGLMAFVARQGYALFGWWRIAVGSAGLIGLV
ncbi:undecaprenyl-diphosphate phosphatase [Allorhizobium sp. BGMRC 0089]|uniref:undecaprenyl-diphosphate phosphatase n=1 Tax=Allorhizobium sonneratiae TaxID=2934936 RepID=UPI0020344F46|nr:undecaprenyl-diphosphate phosphatase [Allorhizobium sonneratiae]MCM2291618.1 undecaprenyl-diphosphate phosphatase [Allorhizobium sonneratiae]